MRKTQAKVYNSARNFLFLTGHSELSFLRTRDTMNFILTRDAAKYHYNTHFVLWLSLHLFQFYMYYLPTMKVLPVMEYELSLFM